MKNNYYLVKEAKIVAKKKETADIYLFTLKLKDGILKFNPGQFVLAGIPGFGESAFDVCSSPTSPPPPQAEGEVGGGGNTFQICVRKIGVNTSKIISLKKGDSLFVRGPYGNGFPIKKLRNKNLLLVGGGTGIIVIRGLIQHFLAENQKFKTSPTPSLPLFKGEGKGGGQNPRIQIFYGARDWKSMLFRDEFKDWKKIAALHLILEEPPEKPSCPRGLITQLFEITKIVEKPSIIMCGPPVMYKFCLQKIQEKLQVPGNKIYLSLERRMHCGIGVCQHCAIGEKYVCKDGPVFTCEELKNIKEAL